MLAVQSQLVDHHSLLKPQVLLSTWAIGKFQFPWTQCMNVFCHQVLRTDEKYGLLACWGFLSGSHFYLGKSPMKWWFGENFKHGLDLFDSWGGWWIPNQRQDSTRKPWRQVLAVLAGSSWLEAEKRWFPSPRKGGGHDLDNIIYPPKNGRIRTSSFKLKRMLPLSKTPRSLPSFKKDIYHLVFTLW